MVDASFIQLVGAACFGIIVGWYLYFINRYRKGDIQLSDLSTVIGIIGGGAVLALFEAKTDLFGAYGVGLALGFFGYLLFIIILTNLSKNFDVDWFLDGRRKLPDGTIWVPEVGTPRPGGLPLGITPKPEKEIQQ